MAPSADPSLPPATRPIPVWDLPIRLFHWAVVGSVVFNVYAGKTGGLWQMDWHLLVGYAVLTLILFRLAWGFVGGRHARFSGFVRGPQVIRAYLRGEWSGPGHNPLGALSVLAMLATLGLLAASGLFANDDIFTEGPLAGLVGKTWSNRLSIVHDWAGNTLFVLIGAHLAAVVYYRLRGEDLVTPMITGVKRVADGKSPPPPFSIPWWRAPLILAIAAGIVAGIVKL